MPENQTRNLLVKKDWFYIIISWSVLMLGFIGILYYAPGYLQQLRSKDPVQYRMAGLQFYNEKKYDQAVEKIEYGLKIAPDNPELNVLMGRSLDKLKQFEKAEIYLKKAISENPKEKRYWYALNWHYYDSNQLSKAEELWLTHIKNEPRNTDNILRLAYVYERMKLPQKAVDMYQKVYMADSQSFESIKGLARNYTHIGNDNKAMEFWLKVVTNQPNDSDAWYNLGRLWEEKKNLKKAEDAFKQALLLDDENYYYNISLARLYFKAGSPSGMLQAEKYFAKCTTINPNYVESYFNLGLIQRTCKNNLLDSIQMFLKVSELNPQNKYAYIELGNNYEKLNQPQKAIDAYRKALKNNQDSRIREKINRLNEK